MRAMTAQREWPMEEQPHRGGCVSRMGRGIAGAAAAGLALLALVLFGVTAFAPELGVRGPGSVVVAGHGVGALFAVAAATVADRTRGLLGFLGGVSAIAIAAITLWWFWLS